MYGFVAAGQLLVIHNFLGGGSAAVAFVIMCLAQQDAFIPGGVSQDMFSPGALIQDARQAGATEQDAC